MRAAHPFASLPDDGPPEQPPRGRQHTSFSPAGDKADAAISDAVAAAAIAGAANDVAIAAAAAALLGGAVAVAAAAGRAGQAAAPPRLGRLWASAPQHI